MHIGIDFDNTLISYDALFHRCAHEMHLIPPDLPPTKAAVRAWLWRQPDGNTPWTELQGEVYGRRMAEAVWFPGVDGFFTFCRSRRLRVSIISHKLEYPARGPRVNLREAALVWMEAHGFFRLDGFNLSRDDVYFEGSREQKCARIAERQCTHFVEDLSEVLLDSAFPPGIIKLLFDPDEVAGKMGPDIQVFRAWTDIQRYVEALAS
ncbi:MAG: haloacid dehalogenase-like hydrolase [Verrucomicrobiota bacterium]